MIRREKGHQILRGRLRNSKQRIEDSRGCTSVLWLDHDGRFLHVREQGAVETFVPLRHDYQRSIRLGDERRPPLGVTQERARSDDSAELLGSVVPADAPGQRTKAKSLAAGQDDGPRACPIRREPAPDQSMRSTCCHERGWSHRVQIATCGFGRFRTLPAYQLPTFGYKRALHSWRPRPGDQHGAQDESERKRAGDSNDRDLQHSAPPVESGPGVNSRRIGPSCRDRDGCGLPS